MPFLTKAIWVDSNERNWAKKAEEKNVRLGMDTEGQKETQRWGEQWWKLKKEKKITTIFIDPEAAVMRLLPPVSVTGEP